VGPRTGKFVISRDLKFDEDGDSTVSTNAKTFEIDASKVEDVVEPREPGPESEPGSERDVDEGYSKSTQEDPQLPQSTLQAPLRRSSRASRPLGEWGQTPALSAQYSVSSKLAARVVPASCKEATSPKNIEFWGPDIAREEYAIARNNTFERVQRKPWMNIIRYKY
jgi:hypothetical protein